MELFEYKDGITCFYLFVGRSGSGKSVLMKCLLANGCQEEKWAFGLCFVSTKFKYDFKWMPNKAVVEGYNEAILERYVGKLRAMYNKDGRLPRSFLIFEDCQGLLDNTSKFFTNFMATFRHLNSDIFITAQYISGQRGISPIIREQVTHAIMFRSGTERTLRHLYEAFGGEFESKIPESSC